VARENLLPQGALRIRNRALRKFLAPQFLQWSYRKHWIGLTGFVGTLGRLFPDKRMKTTPRKQRKNRCWPGYEPVPGKKEHSQGSCRPESKAGLSSEEKKFRTARKRQLDRWEDAHRGSPRKAAQHLRKPKSPSKRKKAKA